MGGDVPKDDLREEGHRTRQPSRDSEADAACRTGCSRGTSEDVEAALRQSVSVTSQK